MPRRPSLKPLLSSLVLLIGLAGFNASAEDIVLYLKSGDRISGTIISENTSRLVISNNWATELSIRIDQIIRRENLESRVSGSATNTASLHRPVPGLESSKTNRWKGETQLGLDFRYGATDRQVYYGRFKLGYERPYESDPQKSFRNGFEYSLEYGKTFGVPSSSTNGEKKSVLSSDRMSGADKTAFDLTRKWYAYNLVGAGYDHLKKINFQYEAGPGLGYHLITRTNFSMNLESGMNYQAQYRTGGSKIMDVYYRVAEDFTWKIADRLSFAERFEFFPRINFSDFRFRFESTLSYEIYRNLSLNLTILDQYDTQLAAGVTQNEVQIRSSLGIKF
jgi:hypothetical protein